MSNLDQIIQQLQNFNNLDIVVTPPQVIPELKDVWQWDTETEWERFLPPSLLRRDFAATPVGQTFIKGMIDNVPVVNVNCSGNGGRVDCAKNSFLVMILKEDLNKVNVTIMGSSIIVTKTEAPLLPFDNLYEQQALKSTCLNSKENRPLRDLIWEINVNSARGFNGSGSFRCRHPNCIVTGPCMTQTSSVRLPHFNYVHTPEDRRYTILDIGFATKFARKRREYNYKILFGNYVYNQTTNSGSLNRLYWDSSFQLNRR